MQLGGCVVVCCFCCVVVCCFCCVLTITRALNVVRAGGKARGHFTNASAIGWVVRFIILPVVVITYLGLLSFFIPIEAGERIGLGMTALLTVLAVMFITMDQLPKTKDVTLLTVFYGQSHITPLS